MKKTKFMSVLVAVLFIFSIINPSFAVVENFSNGKADMGITKDVENNNMHTTSSKVTFNNAKVKNIWRLEDNGTTIYYANVSYGSKESNVEISKNLYNYIASGKVSQENISFSVNEAEPKYVNNTYIIQGIKPKVINGIIEGE
ncbi:hypothetical protein [Candidatus Ruminimicrobium bovinum]|uniref:hypothetical protein n=1 Tax=Candidatus Ruminimicrobium bovinum TaxID=3242779 RepID=UPI0039B8571F